MKQLVKILACVSLTLNSYLITLNCQELPQDYFRNPLNSSIGLSATFAEFRAGHFHAGIDMRTGGAVDQPVYAVADGYVARVSISPWGGGKILYIKHPNGYTSVYMHLNGYAGAIGKAVLKEHYAQQSYSISKIFAPGELPVQAVGQALVGAEKYQYVLPFEFISIFLLACIIGALVVSRKVEEK